MDDLKNIANCPIDLRTILIGLSIIISAGISIFFYLKNRAFSFENSLNDRLFKIQDIAFKNPFLEDKKFINGWDDFVKKYRENSIIDYDNDQLSVKYLQYEQYCEMVFNLMEDTYLYTKDEQKMLTLVNHKAWARTHKSWWNKPLEEHSNHDGYDKNLANIIDSWIK